MREINTGMEPSISMTANKVKATVIDSCKLNIMNYLNGELGSFFITLYVSLSANLGNHLLIQTAIFPCNVRMR